MKSKNTDQGTFIDQYINLILKWKWLVISLCLLITIIVGAGAQHLGFASNYRVFFGADNPDIIALDKLEATYTRADSVMFVVQTPDVDVFSKKTISLIAELTELGWDVPWATRVDSITNFQYSWSEADELIVGDLLPEGEIDQQALDRVRKGATTDPQIYGRLLSKDSRTTALNISIDVPGESQAELPEVVAHVRQLRAQYEAKYPQYTFALVGMVMLNNGFAEAPQTDMPRVMSLMFVALIIILISFLRSVYAAIAALCLVVLVNCLTLGSAGWAQIMLDPVTASAPIIILTLAIADAVHILVSFFLFYQPNDKQADAQQTGIAKNQAIVEAYRINVKPVFLTSITTGVGFISLNFSDSPPFHMLGNLTAYGVMLAWLFSMFFLPAILAVLPLKPQKSESRLKNLMVQLADFVVSNPKSLLITISLVTTLLISLIPSLRLNDVFLEFFDDSVQLRKDFIFTLDNLTGLGGQIYMLESGQESGINDPQFLRQVDKFVEWNRALPHVEHVDSITDTIKRLNMNMHNDDPAYYRIPDSRELIAQYILLYEMNLPDGLDLNNQISSDHSGLRLLLSYRNVESSFAINDALAAQVWREEHASNIIKKIDAVGPGIMFGNIGRRNIEGMIIGTSIGFFVIALILIVALRSVRLGIISLIPNVLPAAMAFGVWALLYETVGFAISVVGGLSIGIVVDDTVHMLTKYQHARTNLAYRTEEAVRYAIEQVGPAIIGTTVIIGGGFAMLSFSTFRVTVFMGQLTSLAIVFALLIDLFLLPTLLLMLDRESHPIEQTKG